MSGPDNLNERILEVLASWSGEPFSADLMQRQLCAAGIEVTIVKVGRRLAKLSREGKCVELPSEGFGRRYRALEAS